MAYYDNFLAASVPPSKKWRNQLQDTVDKQFINASTWYDDIWEEKAFGSNSLEKIVTDEAVLKNLFTKIDCRINSLVDAKSGQRVNDDYKKLIYKNLDYQPKLGQRYYFDKNIWIIYSVDSIRADSSSSYIRRCNNTINTVLEDGSIHIEPCYIDYKITESQIQHKDNIDTPDSRIEVICQNNSYTSKYKINTRIMFNGSVYKIRQFVNFINSETFNNNSCYVLKFYADYENTNETDDLQQNIANKVDPQIPEQPETTGITTIKVNEHKKFTLSDERNYVFKANEDNSVPKKNFDFVASANSFIVTNYRQTKNILKVNCYVNGVLEKTFNIKLGGVI